MEPGYYPYITEHEHHAIPALSKSGIKHLLISPGEYWSNSPANYSPDNRPATRPMLTGSGRHCLLLEGRAAFDSRYSRAVTRRTHPDALDTVEELTDFIASKGEKPVRGSKAKLIQQARELDPDVQILDVIIGEHELASVGKEMLHPDDYEHILKSAEIFEAVRTRIGTGMREVTLVWDDPELGTRCKTRLDWIGLAPAGHGRIMELKDFSQQGKKVSLKKRTDGVFGYERHDIDAMFETMAVKHAPLVVHGAADPDGKADFFERVRNQLPEFPPQNHVEMMFLYQRNDGALPDFVPRTVQLSDQSGALTDIGQAAWASILEAAEVYRAYMAKFGPDVPWISSLETRPIAFEELPGFFQYL